MSITLNALLGIGFTNETLKVMFKTIAHKDETCRKEEIVRNQKYLQSIVVVATSDSYRAIVWLKERTVEAS